MNCSNKLVRFLGNKNVQLLMNKRLYSEINVRNSRKIEGIMPPICTPFSRTIHEEISWDNLGHNLKLWEKIAFTGYVIHGSNGEFPFLTVQEQVDLVKVVKNNVDSSKTIIAGAGCESLKKTIEMCETMAKSGAHYALVITPCFYKNRMTEEALKTYYTKLADSSPIPIIMYNMPANTSIDMSAELCIELSNHPNIVGLKDSGGDIPKLALINENTKLNDFCVIAGSAGFLLEALKVGCTGGICALANVLGNEVVKLYQLFRENKITEAEILQKRLSVPNLSVTRMYGVPALKASLDANGYYGGPVRLPLLSLTEKELSSVRASFIKSGFNWTQK